MAYLCENTLFYNSTEIKKIEEYIVNSNAEFTTVL